MTYPMDLGLYSAGRVIYCSERCAWSPPFVYCVDAVACDLLAFQGHRINTDRTDRANYGPHVLHVCGGHPENQGEDHVSIIAGLRKGFGPGAKIPRLASFSPSEIIAALATGNAMFGASYRMIRGFGGLPYNTSGGHEIGLVKTRVVAGAMQVLCHDPMYYPSSKSQGIWLDWTRLSAIFDRDLHGISVLVAYRDEALPPVVVPPPPTTTQLEGDAVQRYIEGNLDASPEVVTLPKGTPIYGDISTNPPIKLTAMSKDAPVHTTVVPSRSDYRLVGINSAHGLDAKNNQVIVPLRPVVAFVATAGLPAVTSTLTDPQAAKDLTDAQAALKTSQAALAAATDKIIKAKSALA